MKEDKFAMVLNKGEWLTLGIFTEEQIDNADENGFIGNDGGYNCYVTRLLQTN